MLYKIITVLALVAAAQAASVVDAQAAAVEDVTNNREGKGLTSLKNLLPSLLSTFNISIPNDPCDTESTDPAKGVCYSQKECYNMGGKDDGRCANGFGVCCVLSPADADVTITQSGEYFEFSGPAPTGKNGVATATLEPPAGTVQVKLTIEEFNLTPPTEGDCRNDTFVFEGANSNIEVPVLCGVNDGQHMFIDVDNSEGPWKAVASMKQDVDYERKLKVKVDFLSATDPGKAPFRCLQYFPDKEGTISSFNYVEDGDPIMLNNQMYPICFGYVSGMCDIGIVASRFDLGNIDGNCEGDYVKIGCQNLCGDVINDSITANSTGGPITVLVASDDENADLQEGFKANYMMLPC